MKYQYVSADTKHCLEWKNWGRLYERLKMALLPFRLPFFGVIRQRPHHLGQRLVIKLTETLIDKECTVNLPTLKVTGLHISAQTDLTTTQ
ncbi:MAG: hypothetical protein ACI92E_002058 [Oceanicoccus sp.]